jgi:hypothetical protein
MSHSDWGIPHYEMHQKELKEGTRGINKNSKPKIRNAKEYYG